MAVVVKLTDNLLLQVTLQYTNTKILEQKSIIHSIMRRDPHVNVSKDTCKERVCFI